MTQDMSRHFGWGALIRFTLPSMLMMIFTSIYGVVDGLFVSNFAGKTAFAAVNFVMPIIMIPSAVGFMIGTGGSAIVAKTRGEGDDETAKRQFTMLVYSGAIMGVILAVIGILIAEPACALLGAQGQMLADCGMYGRIIFITLPFFVLQYIFQSFFVTAGKPQLGFFVVLGAGCANIVLDFLLVGVFGMGLIGAAIATNVSEILGGGIPLIYFARNNTSFLKFVRAPFEGRVLGRASFNGMSEMVTNIAMSIVGVLYNLQLMRYIGEDGVAAYGVIMYVVMIFAAIFMGYAMGSSPLMSFQYGAKNHKEMQNLFRKSIVFVLLGGVVMFGVAEASAELVATIFVSYDQGLFNMTVEAFRIYAFAYILMGFSIYGSALFTSLGNGIVSAVIALLRSLVFEAGSVLLMPLIFGIQGIWVSISVAEAASFAVTLIFMLALGRRYGFLRRRTPRSNP
ncbi:MAG: MATE family efflux transporter [Eggerthellaceae bacterium]|nr:MATE family efflux transporter [Eggerthellaceae bacterium]